MNIIINQPSANYFKTIILLVLGFHFLRIHPKNIMNPLIELTVSSFLALINWDWGYINLVAVSGQLLGALCGSLVYKLV